MEWPGQNIHSAMLEFWKMDRPKAHSLKILTEWGWGGVWPGVFDSFTGNSDVTNWKLQVTLSRSLRT